MPTLTNSIWSMLMVAKFIKEEGIEEVAIGHELIILLLYVNDVMFFANTLGDA